MDIFVYSDESGVFDKVHNDIFVFGGLIFLSKNDKDIAERKFIAAEKSLRESRQSYVQKELKACKITPKEKNKLFRSTNQLIRFGVVIRQSKIHDKIFINKKSKQRYLDYAFKIALKKAFNRLIAQQTIKPDEVENLRVFVDEHTTATDGCYELKEGLEQEFKIGTFNYGYATYFPPIFSSLKSVNVKHCNSDAVTLIRAADIVANNIYYNSRAGKSTENILLTQLP